ncbi:MAG TPA: polysaccharide deacetylase family protein [Phycisphaerae bacterium]|nr:polysaccharide deacetylase family protein [Phycisphaerae bacterium]
MGPEGEARFRWPSGKRAAVSWSFDDARLSQVDRGLGVLDGCGAKATFYVSVANVEQRLGPWRAAVAAGHEIGNHTLNHPCSGNFLFARDKALEGYTLDRMEAELLEANEAVEDLLGVVPETFAYPCGQTYVGRGEGVRSYVPLVAGHFVVGRAAFSETHNDPAFCDLAQAFSRDADGRAFDELGAMVDQALADGGWLILMGHEIGPEAGARQVTNQQALVRLCEYCLDESRGIWLDTVAAVGKHIQEARSC